MGDAEPLNLFEMLPDLSDTHAPEVEVEGASDIGRVGATLGEALAPDEPATA